MRVYCLRVTVESGAETDWLQYQQHTHLPALLRQPGFTRACVFRVDGHEDDETAYVLFISVARDEDLEAYFGSTECEQLRADHARLFGTRTRVARERWSSVVELEGGR